MTLPLAAFADQIRFRYFGPDAGLRWYYRLNWRLAKLGVSLEVANTALPADREAARPKLKELTRIPRMSTYAIGAVVDKAVSGMAPGSAFVNVGVWNGFTLLSGLANNPDKPCVGVDNFSQFGGPRDAFLERFAKYKSDRHTFHDQDYEEYFAKVHKGPIGVYIYDGEHSYQNQLKGLEAAEPFFDDKCVVIVDDTNDDEPRRATLDFMAKRPGKYEMLFDRRTAVNQHPTFWNGLMVLART